MNAMPGTAAAAAADTAADTTPLYRSIASHVEGMVLEGSLPPGSRVPSLRQMSRQASVSLTTVMEAYRLLEDRGVIEARPQSGHYVRLDPRSSPPEPARTRTCDEAAPLDVAALIARLVAEASQPDLVGPFGAAVPSPAFLPIRRLNTMLGRAVRNDPIASQSYDSVPGRLELRQEIARRAIEAGCSLSPEQIVITTGATEAITLALRTVTKPGDTVAIETPTYHGFLQALESLHLKAREIATDPREGICIRCLAEAIRDDDISACLITASFGNPLGHSMPDDKRRRLAELVAATQIALIEDDTYGDLPFGDRRPPAIQSFDTSGRVLLLSSFTKTLAPGYRVGWIAPGNYLPDLLRTKFSASIATAVPTQMAIAEYLVNGGVDRHLRRLRRTFKDLVRRMIGTIGECFPAGTRVSRPAGGYVLWVELPEAVDSFRLYREALARGISLMPGPLFSASGRYRNCLRINCALPWSARIEDAVAQVGVLAEEQL
jgi:DNA-binding transcriptional MocR family regulator